MTDVRESRKKENDLIGYPNEISYDNIINIKNQMRKNICKIILGKEQGTGFFCKIPFPDKYNMLPVLITNNHIIDQKLLYRDNAEIPLIIQEKNKTTKINLNDRMKYTDKDYDITIIEIQENDNINNYLELDDKIIEDIDKINDNYLNSQYIGRTLYIIHYPGGILSASFGILDQIPEDEKHNFYHKCKTKDGSSGSPILKENNKVIGIHKIGNIGYNYNEGTFLCYPIRKFIDKNYGGGGAEDNFTYKTKIPNNNPNEISFKCTKKILDQMENCVCQIKVGKEQITGFFCKIPFPGENYNIKALITSDSELIYKEEIPIFFQEKASKETKIKLSDKIKYKSNIYNISNYRNNY